MLGFIGSFYAYEGLDLLIAALPTILKQMPDVKVLLVGGGPQDTALKQQVMALDLKDRVVFAGRVPHGEVNRYYDLVDVLVYARHAMRLTELVTPLKPLEAMAQGRLMVASDVGGHKELIQDGKTGVLFRAGQADDLASKVVGLLKDESGWDSHETKRPRVCRNRAQLGGERGALSRRLWQPGQTAEWRPRLAEDAASSDRIDLVVFSALFPSAARPGAGLFIRERMFRVAQQRPLAVVSPQPWFPGQSLIRLLRPGYRPQAPALEIQHGIRVYHPRFLSVPGLLRRFDGWSMALASYLADATIEAAGRAADRRPFCLP